MVIVYFCPFHTYGKNHGYKVLHLKVFIVITLLYFIPHFCSIYLDAVILSNKKRVCIDLYVLNNKRFDSRNWLWNVLMEPMSPKFIWYKVTNKWRIKMKSRFSKESYCLRIQLIGKIKNIYFFSKNGLFGGFNFKKWIGLRYFIQTPQCHGKICLIIKNETPLLLFCSKSVELAKKACKKLAAKFFPQPFAR